MKNSGQTLCFEAGRNDIGLRLDVWLSRCVPQLSRSRIQQLIEDGCVTLAGGAAAASRKIIAGQTAQVEIPPPRPATPMAEDLPIHILYEDRDLIVINKPAGLVVHPAAGHPTGTLVNALLHHCEDLQGIGGELRPGIVHRLDKDTSGCMVAAKNEPAMNALVEQFKAGTVRKEYAAVVYGVPRVKAQRIETLIGRSGQDRKKMSSAPAHGRKAVTHYTVEEVFQGFARIRVIIETGRTHQIRVHMAHIGHPVVADAQYAGRHLRQALPIPVPRQMLHAHTLSFQHPSTGRSRQFEAPIPDDMAALLDALRASS